MLIQVGEVQAFENHILSLVREERSLCVPQCKSCPTVTCNCWFPSITEEDKGPGPGAWSPPRQPAVQPWERLHGSTGQNLGNAHQLFSLCWGPVCFELTVDRISSLGHKTDQYVFLTFSPFKKMKEKTCK